MKLTHGSPQHSLAVTHLPQQTHAEFGFDSLQRTQYFASVGQWYRDFSQTSDAEVIVWLDRGYPLSVKGKGTIAMKGENAQFKLSGQGPMSLDIVTKVE